MSRYNSAIRLSETDKRVLRAARETDACAPLFEAGGMSGVAPRKIGEATKALSERLADLTLDDVCVGLAKLSASGRLAQ